MSYFMKRLYQQRGGKKERIAVVSLLMWRENDNLLGCLMYFPLSFSIAIPQAGECIPSLFLQYNSLGNSLGSFTHFVNVSHWESTNCHYNFQRGTN